MKHEKDKKELESSDSIESEEHQEKQEELTPPSSEGLSDLEQLQVKLNESEKRSEENYDQYLRVTAELENFRRRSEKKISETHQFALTNFAISVSEVKDCLEAALESPVGSEKSMREGVDLTLRKLVSVMEQHHILPITPDIGVAFDPELHMAIGTIPATDDTPENTVAQIIQVGYMISGRVFRAAKVLVSKMDNTNKSDIKQDNAEKNND